MVKQISTLILLFFCVTVLFSQGTAAENELLKRADENRELLKKNPEEAFREAKDIEREAFKIKAHDVELRVINTQFVYYKTKNDFEMMTNTAKSLLQKSISYKSIAYQAIAKRYLFESYFFSGLSDKAIRELEEAMRLIGQLNDKDSLSLLTKGDILVTYSNYWSIKGDYKNRLKYIKLAGEEYKKFSEGKFRQRLLYVHYSNLSAAYNAMGIDDSAAYFALLSQSKDKNYKLGDVTSQNLITLGDLSMKKSDFRNALFYYKETEKIEGYQNHMNIELLYDNIILSYKNLQLEDSVKLYEAKKDSLKLNISENQNKSLHNLLNEKEEEKENYTLIIIVCAIVTVVLIFAIRKKMIFGKKVDKSQHYLKPTSEIRREEDYSTLLEMFKKNDLAFIIYFNEVYPEFSQKLIGLNPKISQSEIEFSAYLKLKIPTKDIVRYRNLAHRTVQNKKYIIRKRLNIPKEKDIYQWFDEV